MELAHAGVPGSHHLGEGRSCQAVVGVRVEAVGQPVHLGPPRPEVLTLPGSSQPAVEDVGVRVGESGNSDAAEAVAIVLGVNRDFGDDASITRNAHIVRNPSLDEGLREEPLTHLTSSSNTARRASAPASQSSSLADSAGQWDAPVGLRTKSIPVGSVAAKVAAS